MIRDSVQAHRLPKVPPLVLVAALVVALAGCGGGGDEARPDTKTFRDDSFGITFQYPDDFERGEVTDVAQAAGGEPVARIAVRIDEDNALLISKYILATAVTEANIEDSLSEIDGLVRRLSGQAARGRIVDVGGLPSVRYDDVNLTEPANGKSRLVFVFDRNNEYLVNCQSTPSERAKVDRACDQALDTLAKS